MPRPRRLEITGFPHHIVQRGVDRQAVFFDDECCRLYLHYLNRYANRHQVAIHSLCLMTNHIHLLMTPETPNGISRLMQATNTGYVQLINQRFRRTGHLWAGRYRSGLIESDHHLLTCMRYIELNPVRAGMVSRPEHYRWSSYHQNGEGKPQPMISAHPVYLALGSTASERQAHYREIVKQPLEETQLIALRQATEQGRVFGTSRFTEQISTMLGRELSPRRRGRPTASKKHRT